jgi:hypothetical protein
MARTLRRQSYGARADDGNIAKCEQFCTAARALSSTLQRVVAGFNMYLPNVFDWFAQDSAYAAEHADESSQRDVWLKLAEQWAAAALLAANEAAG